VVPLQPSGGGRSPFTRTSHGQPGLFRSVICYLTLALAAAAAVAVGSAKAITASALGL
jgi:hypothetical protein